MDALDKIRRKLILLKESGEKAVRELSKQPEIEAVEAELQRLEAEEVRAKEAAMGIQRDHALKLAMESDDEERITLERLAAIRKKKVEALAKFEANIPVRRVQISSQRFVHLTREVEFMQEMGFSVEKSTLLGEKFATRLFEKRKKTEYAIVEAIPSKLNRFFKLGWRVLSGESIEEEPLTPNNSMERAMVAIPDAFYQRENE